MACRDGDEKNRQLFPFPFSFTKSLHTRPLWAVRFILRHRLRARSAVLSTDGGGLGTEFFAADVPPRALEETASANISA